MPYKDPERKKEWERLHRPERLARRRELRRIEAAQQETPRKAPTGEVGASALLIPLIASGALAAYSPSLGIAAGGLTVGFSAVFKKGWAWWAGGVRHSHAWFVFLLEGPTEFRNKFHEHSMKVGSGESYDLTRSFTPHQLAFDSGKKFSQGAGNELI